MRSRLKQGNGIPLSSFSTDQFARTPLLRRVNVSRVAEFIDSGDGWRRVDKTLLKYCIEYILEITNEPMNVNEILDALVDEEIILRKSHDESSLDSILRKSKIQFVRFQDARYWPVRLPCEERGYPGYRDERDARARYLTIFSKDKPVRPNKSDSSVSMPPSKPDTPWVRIRNKVRALEFAVWKMRVVWDNLQPKTLQVPFSGPEHQDVIEQWLFIPSDLVLMAVEKYLSVEGKYVKSDEILELMISENVAIQSFEQRRLLHSTLYHLGRKGKLAHAPRRGYRLIAK